MRCLARILLLVILASAHAPIAHAQDRVWRLGVLTTGETSFPILDVTLGELGARGFVQNRNLQVVERRADAHPERLPALAAELAAAKVDVVIAASDEAVAAAFAALPATPIVMTVADRDPVAAGYAASLAQPGGRVTGQFVPRIELESKRLTLMLEALAVRHRVAVMTEPAHPETIAALRAIAAQRGVEFLAFEAASAGDFESVFARARAAGAEAMMVLSSEIYFPYGAAIGNLTLAMRLPTACEGATHARFGCLISYGFDRILMRRRTADYIARILEGTPPGSLPIEEPTQYELVVNLRAARAIGAEIAPAVLVRADEVIE